MCKFWRSMCKFWRSCVKIKEIVEFLFEFLAEPAEHLSLFYIENSTKFLWKNCFGGAGGAKTGGGRLIPLLFLETAGISPQGCWHYQVEGFSWNILCFSSTSFGIPSMHWHSKHVSYILWHPGHALWHSRHVSHAFQACSDTLVSVGLEFPKT